MPQDRFTACAKDLENKIQERLRATNLPIREVALKPLAGTSGYKLIITKHSGEQKTLCPSFGDGDLVRCTTNDLDLIAKQMVKELEQTFS